MLAEELSEELELELEVRNETGAGAALTMELCCALPPLQPSKPWLVSAVAMLLCCALAPLLPGKPWLVSAAPMLLGCALSLLLPRGQPSWRPNEDQPLWVHHPDVHACQGC